MSHDATPRGHRCFGDELDRELQGMLAAAQLDRDLETLNTADRSAIRLAYRDGLDYRQIAHLLGETPTETLRRLSRSLDLLASQAGPGLT